MVLHINGLPVLTIVETTNRVRRMMSHYSTAQHQFQSLQLPFIYECRPCRMHPKLQSTSIHMGQSISQSITSRSVTTSITSLLVLHHLILSRADDTSVMTSLAADLGMQQYSPWARRWAHTATQGTSVSIKRITQAQQDVFTDTEQCMW